MEGNHCLVIAFHNVTKGKSMKHIRILSLALLAALALPAGAQNANQMPAGGGNANQGMGMGPQNMQPGEPGGRHRGPPPEAVAACNGKAAGTSCTFVNREGVNLNGSCFQPPAGGPNQGAGPSGNAQGGMSQKPIACRPDRPRQEMGNGGNQMGGGQPR